ncbi:hypothetical protein OAN96_00825 [Candidatus Gracilibacteria bacterium]|nr:hypothetical protein [Candidatus Gracilibacteria bacterium]
MGAEKPTFPMLDVNKPETGDSLGGDFFKKIMTDVSKGNTSSIEDLFPDKESSEASKNKFSVYDIIKGLFAALMGAKSSSKVARGELAQSLTPYSNEYRNANSAKFDHLETQDGIKGVLSMIGAIEGGNQYNALVGDADQYVVRLTSMSISEVLDYQETMVASGKESSAVGKYQIINKTLKGLVANHNLDLNAKFDEKMQDRLAIYLMEEKGLNKFTSGKMSKDEFQLGLSQVWAAIPTGPLGKGDENDSYYGGVGSNRALVSSSKFSEQLGEIA